MERRKFISNYTTPVLGFVAFSGTGKTTLLEQVINQLNKKGYRVGLIKHSHHRFDIDHPGKDSYRLRKAGAEQVVVASKNRLVSITEFSDKRVETSLEEAIAAINLQALDILLVEGYKNEKFSKIELNRISQQKPLLFPDDENVIAIAIDRELDSAEQEYGVYCLDLNNPSQIVDYILKNVLSYRLNVARK